MKGPDRPAGGRGGSGRRRAIATAVALAVLFGLLVYFLRPSSKPPEPPGEEPRASKGTDKPRPAGARAAGSQPQTVTAGAPRPSSSPGDDWDPGSPPGTELSDPKAAPKLFPYPPGSQPLTELVDPMSQAKEDDTVDAAQGISCVFGPRVAIVHPPQPLVIDLEVRGKLGGKMPIGNGVARFRAEGSSVEKGPWYSAPLVDDGTGKDLAPGDRAYTATYVPTSAEQTALFKGGSHVFVEVSFEAPNNLGKRTYSTVMQFSRLPHASLNGKYSDAKEQGSLVVQVGVTADQPGTYRVIGSLFAAGDEAIAFGAKSLHLEAGEATIPLLFFGKILHEKHFDGPYELREVMLFEETDPRDVVPGEAVEHAYTTKAYRADEFSPEDYAPPPPDFEAIDMNHPSQQGKPPPLYDDKDRERIAGKSAPIKADPPGKTPSHTFTPGTPGYGK